MEDFNKYQELPNKYLGLGRTVRECFSQYVNLAILWIDKFSIVCYNRNVKKNISL